MALESEATAVIAIADRVAVCPINNTPFELIAIHHYILLPIGLVARIQHERVPVL